MKLNRPRIENTISSLSMCEALMHWRSLREKKSPKSCDHMWHTLETGCIHYKDIT